MKDIFKSDKVKDLSNSLLKEIVYKNSTNDVVTLANVDGDINFIIDNDCEVNLSILLLPITNNDKKIFNLNFDLHQHSKLTLNIANLSNVSCDDNITINLIEEGSSIEFYSSTILNKNTEKNSIIKVVHLAKNTTSNIKAYEVLKDTSKGFIRCISDIRQGSSSSEAHQELRLLVLDKNAKANSDPVLLIDENDIVASHANAIGMLDPDQIFYLESRGLSKTVAQELIINGYFEPVFIGCENEEIEIYLKEILKGMN
ncbi:FeS assembly protein SufD [Spiroplasma helicoides]|uniref:FeS assembly protein SufD n=1 Tax=Spiroplasma helicoides TaxID=216938 RepID=A0A1B3SL95_9MOLU|nr:SufD family Fe-S cluster assembly protein [Spiroplasma helicoides]AOG60693.1 FeS assembly protein SufD [Spiroplasma helicoides]